MNRNDEPSGNIIMPRSLITAVILIAMTSSSEAGIIALDSFNVGGAPGDYTMGPNGSLVGQNPPRLGFDGAWYQSGGGSLTKGGAIDNGLTYSAPGLGTIGGTGGTHGSIFTYGFSAVPARDFDASLQTGTETDYWMRFLIAMPTVESGDRGTQFLSFHFTDHVFNIFVLDQSPSPKDKAFDDLVSDVDGFGNTAHNAFHTDDSANLVIAHISANRGANEDEQFRLWVNPDSNVLGLPTLSFSDDLIDGGDTLEWMRVNMGAQNANGSSHPFNGPLKDFYFDELLISTEMSDLGVVESEPVPEPSTLVLLGMGVATLGGVRWRRKRRMKPAV